MTDPATVRAFLQGEIESLAPFAFLLASPAGRPLHVIEVVRRQDRSLEVRIPGRPPLVPELPVAVRSALRDRSFRSEDPADRGKPWVRAVPDAAAAVALLQEVLTEVFEDEPDVPLDVGHGSHEAEHQAAKKLEALRERVEKLLVELDGGRPEQDEDGDYVLPLEDVHVVVAPRVAPDGPAVLRVFAITNAGVNVTPELGLFLARLNFGLMFGRFALDTDHRAIWFDETLLGDHFTDEELRFVVRMVAHTADAWDDRLKQMFGGLTYQEVLKGRSGAESPPVKPGQGGYI